VTPKLPPTLTPLKFVPRPSIVLPLSTQTKRAVAVKFRSLAKLCNPGSSPPVPPLIRVPPAIGTLVETFAAPLPLSKTMIADATSAVEPTLSRTSTVPPAAGSVASTPKLPSAALATS
jgi:hypothetical protein